MSKLLKEDQVRRFMKLASIGSLSEGFVDTLEEEEVEEVMGMYKRDGEDEPVVEEEELELEMDAEGDDAEVDMEMDAEEGGAGLEGDVMDIITTITNALEQEYPDLDIDVSGDGDEGADMDADMDADMGDEAEMDAPEDLGEMEHGKRDDDEEVREAVDVVEEDELVAEVLKRVTARLRKALKESKNR